MGKEKIYLLINTEVGKELSVRNALREIDNVISADMIGGRYDIIAIVEGEPVEEALSMILRKIRSIDGIIRTETNLVIE